MLITVIAVLVLVAAGLGTYLAVREDETTTATGSPEGGVSSADDRPVTIPLEEAQKGAAAAAESAVTIVSTSWKDYDDQIDEAVDLMTPEFAQDYRETAESAQVRDGIVTSKAVVEVRVVAQSVVRADSGAVQALLFLNQYVTKGGGDTTYVPYRVLVTVVHTDKGWLVSGIDTD